MEAPSPIEDDAVRSAPPTIGGHKATIVDDPSRPSVTIGAGSTAALGDRDARRREDDDADVEWDAPVWIDRVWDRVGALGWPRIITFLTVAAATLLVVTVLHPGLILRDTTPTGGDMGAHVWGPAYLRDHLLPNFRLSGWAPDWYNGFPAFQFYMVLPSLLIVLLNVGLDPLPAAAMIAAMAIAVHRGYREERLYPHRRTILYVACFVSVLVVGMPYGVAFKIVAALGVATMPLSAYLLGRFSNMPFPLPAMMSVAMLPFVFDRSFNILGGNIASTMAGEFAFSLSLSLSLIYLGLMYRALDSGRSRGWAALTFAACALCHLLVAFVIIGVTVVMFAVRVGRTQLKSLVLVGGVGGALTAFWVLPFFAKRTYVNDMGWVKIKTYANSLLWRSKFDSEVLKDSPPFRVVFAIAVVGLLLSVVRRNRMGVVLAISAAGVALAFRVVPDGGRLWNGRILPAYYLYVYLLAAIGLGELARTIAELLRAPELKVFVRNGAPIAAFLSMWLVFGPSLRALPGGHVDDNGIYNWPKGLSLIQTRDTSFLPGWAEWNWRGYEARTPRDKFGGYPEYFAINQMMREIGEQHGCGRAMWEYDGGQEAYGTTMAMMLLPHWTDGCIPSQEGLYFEASSTTAFHFLNQSALSQSPSRAQSHIVYPNFDVALGVQQLQLMGVRYYMAASTEAVRQANANPDLTEVTIGSAGPWHIYLVADSDLVQPLDFEPVVYSNVSEKQSTCAHNRAADDECIDRGWLNPAVAFFNDPEQWSVLRGASGPSEWQRWAACLSDAEVGVQPPADGQSCDPPQKELPPVEVSNITWDDDEVTFDVDQVGVPVLVKVSYFPNWKVSGGEGPYRVTPNLMVVVPKSNHVRLHYGYTGVDYASNGLTLLGLVALFFLFRANVEEHQRAWWDPVGRAWRRRPRPATPNAPADDTTIARSPIEEPASPAIPRPGDDLDDTANERRLE